MLYKFEQGYNIIEATKNIWYVKDVGIIDNSTVTRQFKKFHSGCKYLNDQKNSAWLKSVDSKATLQTIETNPINSTQRISGKLGISQCSLHDFGKTSGATELCFMLPKYCRIFDSPKYSLGYSA